MKLLLRIFLFFVLTLPVFADTWHEPDAKYRIEVSTDMPDLPGYADFNRVCLPDKSLDNGVSVYDPSGKKLPYILNLKNRGVVFGEDKDNSKRFIYFGYSKPVAADFNAPKIGKTAKRSPLRLTVVRCHTLNVSLDEWIKQKLIYLEKRHSGSINYAKGRIPGYRQAYLDAEKKYGPQRDLRAAKSRKIRNEINHLKKDISTEKRKLSSVVKKLKVEKRKKRNRKNIAKYQGQINGLNKQVRALYKKLDLEYKSLKKNEMQYHKVRRNIDRLRGRYEWSQRDLKNREKKREKDIKKLMVSAKEENGRELEFLRYFSPERKVRSIGSCLAEKIYLTNMPFGFRSGFAAEFKGTLVADKDGEYTFAVDSTSNVLLFIDDELVLNWYGDRKPNENWSKNCKLRLTRGLHDFKLYYKRAKRSQEAYVEAAWKKPGDKAFKVMSELDFAPGRRSSMLAFSDASGNRYPLVKADKQISIFTGKKERLFWINCKIINDLEAEWLIGSKKVAQGSPVSLFYKDDMKKEFGIKQENAPVIALTIPEYESSREIHTPARLDMKLWLPDFIYDDENLHSYLEIFSGLPSEVTCLLNIKGDKQSNPFKKISGKYTISGMVNDPKKRFEPDSSLKFMVPLNGKTLKDGMTVNFDLAAGGISFARKSVRFVPLDAVFQLETDEEGFVDANGSRVIPVLHRPGLDELRRWQLPVLFMNSLFVPNKILIVADDFGKNGDSFFSELKKQYQAAGIEVEVVGWKTGQPGIDGLPKVMRAIRDSDAGAAVVIPPHLDPVSTPRRQKRLLSALIQLMRTNSDIKLIKLATPFPGDKDAESIVNIKKISREYGIDILSLNSYVKQLNGGDEIDDQAEDNTFPVSHKAEIAEFIAAEKW